MWIAHQEDRLQTRGQQVEEAETTAAAREEQWLGAQRQWQSERIEAEGIIRDLLKQISDLHLPSIAASITPEMAEEKSAFDEPSVETPLISDGSSDAVDAPLVAGDSTILARTDAPPEGVATGDAENPDSVEGPVGADNDIDDSQQRNEAA